LFEGLVLRVVAVLQTIMTRVWLIYLFWPCFY